MRPLLMAGVLMLSVGLLPAIAGAQHRDRKNHDGHHNGKADAPPAVVEAPMVRPTVVKPVVVGPSVAIKQPIVAGWDSERSARPGFGSAPIRTGFGSTTVRTGFDSTTVRTGFASTSPETITADQADASHGSVARTRHGRSSKRFRGSKPNQGTAVILVPVPYSYTYEPPFGVAASPTSRPSPFESRLGARNRGITAGLSTYWIDMSNQPGASAGLAFDVPSAPAEVYVDDVYAGVVQDFATGRDPLMVVPGTHRIELRAPGYHPVSLDVTIVAGQVIPLSGELDPLRSY